MINRQFGFVMKSITSIEACVILPIWIVQIITLKLAIHTSAGTNIADRGLSDEITYLNGVTFTREALLGWTALDMI